MFETGGEDERPGRLPPPADDRLWRHPSEVARAAGKPSAPTGPPTATRAIGSGPGRRFSLGTVVVATSLGALVMLTVVAGFGMVASMSPGRDAAGAPGDATRAADLTSAPSDAAAGVVAVRVGDAASGVVGAGLVLDGAEVVVTALSAARSDGATAWVATPQGKWVGASVLSTDPATGLSLLKADAPLGEVARPAPAPSVDDDVTLIAVHPSGAPSDSAAHSTSVLRTNSPLLVGGAERVGLTVLLARQPVTPAQVAVDDRGAVVALVCDHDDDPDDRLGYALPAEVAVRVGEQLGNGGPDQGRIDASIVAADAALSVVDVVPGGRAAVGGLLPDDEVTTVDSTPVSTTGQLAGALVGRSSGDWVSLGVRRDRRIVSIRVQLVPTSDVTAPASTTTLVSATVPASATFP